MGKEQSARSRHHVVGFMMPADVRPEGLPDPADPSVRTPGVPAETAAALRFSGRWTRRSFEKDAARLLAAVDEVGLTVVGGTRYARFAPGGPVVPAEEGGRPGRNLSGNP